MVEEKKQVFCPIIRTLCRPDCVFCIPYSDGTTICKLCDLCALTDIYTALGEIIDSIDSLQKEVKHG